MRLIHRLVPLAALAVLAACADQRSPTAPQTDLSANLRGRFDREITVMTRNMYIGTDVDAAMAAIAAGGDPTPGLLVALGTLQHTDFATRVKAIAAEIRRNHPDVVGLQEVYDLSVIPAGLGLPGDPIQISFLPALQAALRANGLHYEVAAKNTTTDAAIAGGAIHIVDHDVILVDPRSVRLEGRPIAAVYQAVIGPVPGVDGLSLLRGYTARRANIDGVQVLLVNTHLESGDDPQIAGLRMYQAMELAGFIGKTPRVILTGDFNDVAGSPMYGVLAGASLTDTWAALRPSDPGLSCCQAADLSNTTSQLYQRIDIIWTRGFADRRGQVDGEIKLVSADPSAMVQGAFGLIWPSDHAGVAAEIDVPLPSIHH